MLSLMSEILLPVSIFVMMFAIGLTLSIDDFRRIASERRSIVLGTAMQLLVTPLVGIGLALAFGLTSDVGAGLVVLAACPGGLISNLLVFFAGGSTALSVSLTGIATLFTLGTVPVWVSAYSWLHGGEGAAVNLPIVSTALELGLLTILPMCCGIAWRERAGDPEAVSRRLSKWSLVAIIVAMMMDFQGRPLPIGSFSASVVPAFWLATVAGLLGVVVCRASGVSGIDTATIAVELVAKNGLLAIAIARSSIGFEAMMPSIAFQMFQAPIAVFILAAWRFGARPQRI
ncbi:MAG: hypothetical protein NXI30_02625 [bacterium]|nr:hypothetical protein [bacterium]